MANPINQLQIGQTVTLKEMTWGYQVTLLPPDQPGCKVVEVGPEHIVFDDEATGVKTRLPVFLITSVTTPSPVPQAA